ncbi:MAG: hypothetical protein JWN04_6340 [Myxococcaceae bacterium]|nr:hypothetical protein [Myxococcaceae bacterium]
MPPAPDTAAPRGLPILGDPLGLLSKASATPTRKASGRDLGTLAPGALMAKHEATGKQDDVAPGSAPERASVERDARAVERGRTSSASVIPMPVASGEVREVSAARLMRELRDSAGKVRVLFLYASYCKACRGVMPTVLDFARRYYSRGVRFTAASVDKDRDAFSAYAPVLSGLFPAILITPDGTTGGELKRLGVPLQGSGFSIPMVAVLDRKQHLIAYGNSSLAEHLDRAVEPLLQE